MIKRFKQKNDPKLLEKKKYKSLHKFKNSILINIKKLIEQFRIIKIRSHY